MEVTTIQRYIHTPPRKLRLVADMVRTMEPKKALDILRLTPKYAAWDLVKALETVLANARRVGLDTEKVVFRKIEIDESTKMRRFRAGTRGRAKPYKKRMSHIKIVLSDEAMPVGPLRPPLARLRREASRQGKVISQKIADEKEGKEKK